MLFWDLNQREISCSDFTCDIFDPHYVSLRQQATGDTAKSGSNVSHSKTPIWKFRGKNERKLFYPYYHFFNTKNLYAYSI